MMRGNLLALSIALLVGACSFTSPDGAGGDDGDDDGTGSAADPKDGDGDGVGANDNCPEVANKDQVDADGDGVGDECDNCAGVANPRVATMGFDGSIQRDHDADGRGDACDLCPHLASATQDTDPDGDGIGTPCDPEPTAANPPPYWNGFYEAPDSAWQAPAKGGSRGDWQLARRDDGALGWRQSALDTSQRHHLLLSGSRAESVVQTRMIVEEVAPAGGATNLRSASVSSGFGVNLQGQDVYYNCGVRRDAGSGASDVVLAVLLDDSYVTGLFKEDSWSGNMVGAPLAVTARAERTGLGDAALRCGGTDGATSREPAFTAGRSPAGQVGLRAYGMRVWFDYVFIVEPRPAP